MPETKPTLQLEHRMCGKTRKYKAKKVMGRIFLSEKIAANNTSDKGLGSGIYKTTILTP